MEGEKNQTVRRKLSKERTNINRWLGDVTQAPETFTNIELSKYTDKQLGQRVHSVARGLMNKFNIDPKKASLGGSTQHHIDSIMQMQGAYEGASIDTIFRINESLREKDIYLGTNAEGRNFYDVNISTHPEFHKLTPDEKVDYSNKWAKIESMPSATPAERLARLEASSEITQDIARRASASPLNQRRVAALTAAVTSQDPELGKNVPELFVPGQPKKLEIISNVKKALTEKNGSVTFAMLPIPNPMDALDVVRKNAVGALTGAVSFVEPEAIKSAMKGDYGQAATQTFQGATAGAIVEGVSRLAGPTVTRVAASVLPKSLLSIGAGAAKFAPPLLAGYLGYQVLDAFVEGSTGHNLQETGVLAEQKKQKLREQGYSEHELRRRARTGWTKP